MDVTPLPMPYPLLRRLTAGAVTVLTAWLLASAQGSHAAEVTVSSRQLPMQLGPYLDYRADPERTLTLDEVQRSAPSEWVTLRSDIPTFGVSDGAHWLHGRLRLDADVPQAGEWALKLDSPQIDRIEVTLIQAGRTLLTATLGDTVPLSRQPLPLHIPAITLPAFDARQPLDIYLRVTSTTSVEIPLSLLRTDTLLLQQRSIGVGYGAFFTFLSLCLLVSVLIQMNLPDRLLQAVSGFLASCVLFFLTLTGMGRLWFWPETETFNTRLVFVSSALLILCFCQVGRALQVQIRYRDSIELVLRVVAIGMLPTAVYYALIPFDRLSTANVLPLMVMGFVVALTMIGLAVLSAIKGSRIALFLALAWTLMLLSHLLTMLYRFGLIERLPALPMISLGGFVVSLFCLLMALSAFIRSKARAFQSVQRDISDKNDFLRKVSRELLTPVHLVLANAQRLRHAPTLIGDPDNRQVVDTIATQSGFLHNLINDLLEMAELESDDFGPQLELVELTRLLNQIRDGLNRQAEAKGLSIAVQGVAANLLLQTDRLRLQHALQNLVQNAIKYSDQSTITLSYQAIYYRRQLGVEISVIDTGRGMSEAFKRRVFQEFARETPDSPTAPRSTGLSLVIVKRMVDRLGGEISFESTQHKGSRFVIRLPLRHSSE